MLSAEGASSRTDLSDDERAALVAALLSVSTPSDAPLLRELTSQEIAFVTRADSGCGDVLLACCWLLFVNGQVEDSALVWRAKNVNFDAHCYVDSVFLVAHGVRATAEFARAGLGGARVDRIAARAGANKRMLYYYYGNKEALFLAVMEASYERIRTAERSLHLAEVDPEEGIRRLLEWRQAQDTQPS